MSGTRKVVIVLSGGPDSSTLAYWVKSEGYDIYPISFNYGQIASKEVQHAKLIANKLDAETKVVDVSSLKGVFAGSTALVDRSIPMPTQFEQAVIVPFRNAIFLSVAVAYAVSIGSGKVFYGAHGSDASFYPDCRREFVDAFQKAVTLGTERNVMVESPFHVYSKADIIRLGAKLGVPFELTWSCYLDGEYHCGYCESCVNRKKGFRDAGVTDPTEYAK